MLTIPPPTLVYEPLAPGVAPSEMPLTVAFGAVLHNGTPLAIADATIAGLHAYRRVAPGAAAEIWQSDLKAWVPDPTPALDAIPVEAFAFLADKPQPWQGIVVPSGSTDPSGAPRFTASAGGYPAYSFRGRFALANGEAGVSAATSPVSFGSLADRNLMVLGPGDDEKPENATLARIELKNPDLSTTGGLMIQRESPAARITISNAAGGSIVIEPDGSIRLRPAPGRKVVVDGDLETGQIVYVPAGGGAKKALG